MWNDFQARLVFNAINSLRSATAGNKQTFIFVCDLFCYNPMHDGISTNVMMRARDLYPRHSISDVSSGTLVTAHVVRSDLSSK